MVINIDVIIPYKKCFTCCRAVNAIPCDCKQNRDHNEKFDGGDLYQMIKQQKLNTAQARKQMKKKKKSPHSNVNCQKLSKTTCFFYF